MGASTGKAAGTAGGTELGEISAEELLRRAQDPKLVVVNVLPRATFESAHIPGSINLPLEQVYGRAGEVLPDRSGEIVAYCAGPS